MTIAIQPAGHGVLQELAADLHPDDAAELRAAGLSIDDALGGVPMTEARHDGRLLAVFGCADMVGGEKAAAGIPWMLSTRAIDAAPRRAVALAADRIVSTWQATHTRLSNLVHRRNARAIAFVRWLGFTVYDNQPTGPGGEFFLFDWSAECATP